MLKNRIQLGHGLPLESSRRRETYAALAWQLNIRSLSLSLSSGDLSMQSSFIFLRRALYVQRVTGTRPASSGACNNTAHRRLDKQVHVDGNAD